MLPSYIVTSLLLATSVPSDCLAASTPHSYRSLRKKKSILAARDESPPQLPCGTANGTEIFSNSSAWTILCDTDFLVQDIYPFILAKTFEECMQCCEEYNSLRDEDDCLGFVFAPDRINLEDSCYLKSSLHDIISPATIHLIAATLNSRVATSTIISPVSKQISPTIGEPAAVQTIVIPPKSVAQSPESRGKRPTVTNSTYLGTSVDEAASRYVSHSPAQPEPLSAEMLESGINIDLIAKYPLASDTGSWTGSDASEFSISEMKITPRLARDGGRGGNINGTNVFIFCDTSTYGQDKDPVLGYLNGFVSTSVAVDHSLNALEGKPLLLVNSLGQWQDDVGRMRGWVPMTTGEEAFNIAVSGKGYRYAVWPNASPITLNITHSILYAPLVYLEVDMNDQASTSYTSLGNTLLLISVDPIFGPHADRLQKQFFLQDEVNWGSLGGIRAWSEDGQKSLNGEIYILGQADHGVLIGKVAAHDFHNRSSYTYWDGHTWSKNMPPASSTSNAFILGEPVMTIDIIYSPAHKTFIMIYLTPQADNTFYYRYLTGKNNETINVIPPYEDGGDDTYVEAILVNMWSPKKVLFTMPAPIRGYAYAGGIHAGYFGDDDITSGGVKILCTWTEHTRVDPEQPDSGYAHKSQVVELGFED